jgi:hypothetical protein
MIGIIITAVVGGFFMAYQDRDLKGHRNKFKAAVSFPIALGILYLLGMLLVSGLNSISWHLQTKPEPIEVRIVK